ncbi:hypothetical protein [Mesorhizobium onobrychidis]|uniref:Uncharacterized protein n=1 Tax=Mesorhizobium onobrychidis TaxID=2775404 RepID=A0ABY5R2Z6_9HYPH|nr:hypothetical protein [Mesorhizobium onobrychidis]UVC17850.1 hypothetical protein IHQ72_12565 [Mesorhizobium onobrychidis]
MPDITAASSQREKLAFAQPPACRLEHFSAKRRRLASDKMPQAKTWSAVLIPSERKALQ